jgi:C4-dicarboxylate-specific signal transduction histidine kinase
LSDALSLCRQRVESRGVPVEAPDVPPDLRVLTRRSEAAQIMLNLVGNAFDAVAALAERWIKIEVAGAADRVTISVTDSGRGVPEEHRGGLFRPFFTTKPVGKGTGLGLAVSRQLAESHGGALELDPTSEHTRFVLTLTKA